MANEIYHRSNWGNAVNDKYWADVYEKYSATNKMYIRSDYYENSNETDKLMADIYPKPSILLTPTAYDNGSLHSVKPVKTFGSELVTNGDFSDGTNNWTLDDASNGSISVVDGKLQIVSNGGVGYPVVKQGVSTSIGKKYSITFSVTNNTTGFWFRVSQFESHLSGDTTFYANDKTSLIKFKGEFTSISTTSYLKIFAEQNDAGSFQIDDISIKEIQEADFDFTRGSSATRVNEKGLIEDVQILSGELVQNGDFEQIGSELVTNGNFSQIGSELITNGDFATDTNWTKGTGWSISGGYANANNASGELSQSGINFDTGKLYKVQYTISGYLGSGGVNARLKGAVWNTGLLRQSDGTFTETILCTAENTILTFVTSSSFTGSIDNVSVKEVGQDWTFSDGATVTDNGARIVSDGAYQYIIQNNVLTVGKQYKVQYEILENNSGNLKMSSSLGVNPIPSSVGTHIINGQALQTFLGIERSGACDITITNISVKEVGQNWSLDGGWSVEDGLLVNDGTGVNLSATQSGFFTVGNKYRVSLDVKSITQGSLEIYLGFPQSDIKTINSSGSYTYDIIASGNTTFYIKPLSNFIGSIDNVSVIEITDDTDLPRINYTNFDYENGVVVPYSGEGSLLLEPQSTNLVTYSEDFDNSYWQHNANITVTSSSELAPNGKLNANLIEYDGAGYCFIRTTLGAPSTAATISVFAKKGNWRYLGFRNFQNEGNDHTVFDFDTETFSNIASGQSASFEIFPNGWYRIIVTQPSPTSNPFVGFAISNSTGSELDSTGGQVANVHLFGAQLEQQSYATSYIPTNGSTVTRLADVCNNAGSSDLINSTEGVLYAEISALANDLSQRQISIDDGVGNNRIILRYNNVSNNINAYLFNGSVQGGEFNYVVNDITEFNKIAFKFKQNDFSLYVNGTEVATDTSGNTFSANTLKDLSFDFNGNFDFYGNVKSVAVFKEALDNDQLERLTGEGYETFNLLAQANNYTII